MHDVAYRKTQAHLKPYTPQGKNLWSTQPTSQPMAQLHHMWPVKQPMAQSDHKKSFSSGQSYMSSYKQT